MSTRPPGWPRAVPPPGVAADPDSLFNQRCTLWLLDQCPPEYRTYPLLQRHPLILAWLLRGNTHALTDAARRHYATARAELSPWLPADTVCRLLATVEQEGARLLALQREADLVLDALQHQRH